MTGDSSAQRLPIMRMGIFRSANGERNARRWVTDIR